MATAILIGLFNKFFGNKDKHTSNVKDSLVDYNRYFDATTVDDTPLEFLNLGELVLPTGKMIACDPLANLYDSLPVTKTVNPGKYPGLICVAKTERSGDRYAFAKLELSRDRAVRWEMALTDQQDIGQLKEDSEYYGFPIDAGLGCFCDSET